MDMVKQKWHCSKNIELHYARYPKQIEIKKLHIQNCENLLHNAIIR